MQKGKIAIIIFSLFISCSVFAAENPCKEMYSLYEHACPRSSFEEFSRGGRGNYDYYSNTINQDNFWAYCRKASNQPVSYSEFEKNVCKSKVKNLVFAAENSCKDMYSLYEHECPVESLVDFSRLGMDNYRFYSNTINKDNFWAYCQKMVNQPVSFTEFQKNVCNKKAKNIDKAAISSIPKNVMKTRHGDLILTKLTTKDNEKYFLKIKNKSVPLPDKSITAADVRLKSYQLVDVNVFFIGYAIGNAYQGSILVADRPDGIYIAVVSYPDQIQVKAGKLIIIKPVKYKQNEVIEFDGKNVTSNYDHHKDLWKRTNISLKKIF